MPTNCPTYRVFISFHERDIAYKERFVAMMQGYMVDESVDTGDIVGSNLPLRRSPAANSRRLHRRRHGDGCADWSLHLAA